MSSPLDVRAKIYCNLGEVISGTISDASLIDAGLVPTNGTIVLEGMYTIDPGQVVDLAYYKNSTLARLGKRLRVITSYANPMTNTTEVTVGCKLAVNAAIVPSTDVVLTRTRDPYAPRRSSFYLPNLTIPGQLRAKFIVEEYLRRLNIAFDFVPLTNVFTLDKFTTKEPYLKVVSDMLKSEAYVGYMDSLERLRFIKLSEKGGVGPIFDENNVIDMRAINEEGQYYTEPDVPYSVVAPKKITLPTRIRG